MSDNKKYYYLKLKENFFDREEVKIIKGLDKGDTYICIMLELYLRSLKRNGSLMITDHIPYSLQTLGSVLNRPQDEVKYAIDIFKQFGLVEIYSNGEIFMREIQNFIGNSSSEADRKRSSYIAVEERKLLETGDFSEISPPEIEIELKIEKEIELKVTKVTIVTEVIDFFNLTTGRKYKGDKEVIKHINQLSKDYSLEDFKNVITFVANDKFYIDNGFVALSTICKPTKFAEKLERSQNKPNTQSVRDILHNCNSQQTFGEEF